MKMLHVRESGGSIQGSDQKKIQALNIYIN